MQLKEIGKRKYAVLAIGQKMQKKSGFPATIQ